MTNPTSVGGPDQPDRDQPVNRFPPPVDPGGQGAQLAGGFDTPSPQDEMLVAYLDGELDGDDVAAVENQLASDPKLKRRLEELRNTWDLLEELPPARPNPNFAQSTIEMVAMSAAALEASPRAKRYSRFWWVATLLAVPAMLVLGYMCTRALQRYVERHTIEQVHVLADWDAFKAVDSFEWLQMLADVQEITTVAKRSATSGLGIDVVPETISERRQWIQSLGPTDRDRLSANLEEFKRVSPAESERVIKLADQVYASKDRDNLLQLARSYSIFLNDMSISDRTSYRDQKNMEIRLSDLKRRIYRKLVVAYASDLSPKDRETIANWKKEIQDLIDRLNEERSKDDPLTFIDELWGRMDPDGYSCITEEHLNSLLSDLSPQAQDVLSRLQPDEVHTALILDFVINSSRPRGDRAERIEQYRKLPPNIQSELEFSPPEIAQRRLERLSNDGNNAPGRTNPQSRVRP